MAVSIDNVYQKVLAIANKEQRGYITPQEFNLFADQVQMDIFEQYFYDINQFNRVPGNDTKYADMIDLLNEKISLFEEINQDLAGNNGANGAIPKEVYKLGQVMFGNSLETSIAVEKVRSKDLPSLFNSKILSPTLKKPVYIRHLKPGGPLGSDQITLHPISSFILNNNMDNITINYIKRPKKVYWGYVVVNSKALYDDGSSTDFELHPSEETNLVIKILTLAGISTKDISIYQAAATEDNKNIQQEKQ